jgi:hypothetical protein
LSPRTLQTAIVYSVPLLSHVCRTDHLRVVLKCTCVCTHKSLHPSPRFFLKQNVLKWQITCWPKSIIHHHSTTYRAL